MSTSTALLTVLALAVGTYSARSLPILVLAGRALPPLVVSGLRYVGPAVLSALVVSLIASPEQANNGVTAAEVAGIAVAIPVAWKTGNLVATLGVGMTVFWIVLGMT